MPSLNVHIVAFVSAALLAAGGIAAVATMAADGTNVAPSPASTVRR